LEKINVIRLDVHFIDQDIVNYEVVISDDIQKFVLELIEKANTLIADNPVSKMIDMMSDMKELIETYTGHSLAEPPARPTFKVTIIGGIDGVRLGNKHSVEQWLINEGTYDAGIVRGMEYLQLMRTFDKRIDELKALSTEGDKFAEIMQKATSHIKP